MCDHLDEFVDGELSPEEALAFQVHLPDCERCKAVLEGRMQEVAVVGAGQAVVGDGRAP